LIKNKRYCIFLQEEYEAARAELIEELNRGVSLEKLRAKLTKAPEAPESDESDYPASQIVGDKIPEDLVQVQAFIRWEKVGKPNYPPEKQLVMH
jgi:alpha-glucan,water dikinase